MGARKGGVSGFVCLSAALVCIGDPTDSCRPLFKRFRSAHEKAGFRRLRDLLISSSSGRQDSNLATSTSRT